MIYDSDGVTAADIKKWTLAPEAGISGRDK